MRDGDYLLTLAFHHAHLEHGPVLLAEDRHDVFVGIKGLTLDHKGHIAKVWIVQHRSDSLNETAFALWLEVPVGVRVRVQLVHVLEIVLPVAATNDVQLGADERH